MEVGINGATQSGVGRTLSLAPNARSGLIDFTNAISVSAGDIVSFHVTVNEGAFAEDNAASLTMWLEE